MAGVHNFGVGEIDWVTYVEGSRVDLKCSCGETLPKTHFKAVKHFENHGVDKDDLKSWLCLKDIKTVYASKGRRRGARFRTAWEEMYASNADDENSNEARDEEDGDLCQARNKFGVNELRYVAPGDVPRCNQMVKCTRCNVHLQFGPSVLSHFTKSKAHRLDEDMVKGWLCYTDGKSRGKPEFPSAWLALRRVGKDCAQIGNKATGVCARKNDERGRSREKAVKKTNGPKNKKDKKTKRDKKKKEPTKGVASEDRVDDDSGNGITDHDANVLFDLFADETESDEKEETTKTNNKESPPPFVHPTPKRKAAPTPNTRFLQEPGQPFGRLLLVPDATLVTLLGQGLVEEVAVAESQTTRHLWAIGVPTEMQKSALIDALPESSQRAALKQKFGSPSPAPTIAAVGQQPCQTDAIAAAIQSSVSAVVSHLIPKKAVQPTLRIDTYWEKEWQKPEKWATVERVGKVPLVENFDIDLRAFEVYLTDDDPQLDPEKSVPPTMKAMRRVLGMLKIEWPDGEPTTDQQAGDATAVGLVSAMHDQGLFRKLFGLKVLSPERSWGRSMFTAFKHYVSFARAQAIKLKMSDKENIEDLQDKFEALTRVHTEAKGIAGMEKQSKDAERIEAMPEKEDVQRAVRQSMFDLDYLHKHTLDKDELTVGQRASAATLVVGIMYCNGKPGRCGEYFTMTMEHARQRLEKEDEDWLEAKDHKTRTKRGALVKVLAQGTKTAMRRYMSLPSIRSQKYLLQGARKGKGQTAAKHLEKFDLAYFQRKVHYGTNLVRKKRATDRRERSLTGNNLQKLGAWEDGHAELTEEMYIAMSHTKKARIARSLLDLEIDPVEFPTEEEAQSMNTVFFAKRKRGDGGISAEALASDPAECEKQVSLPKCFSMCFAKRSFRLARKKRKLGIELKHDNKQTEAQQERVHVSEEERNQERDQDGGLDGAPRDERGLLQAPCAKGKRSPFDSEQKKYLDAACDEKHLSKGGKGTPPTSMCKEICKDGQEVGKPLHNGYEKASGEWSLHTAQQVRDYYRGKFEVRKR